MTDTAAPWSRPAAAVMAETGSGNAGLDTPEAARRLEARGPNRLPEAKGPGPLVRLWRQFDNLLILVLVAAAAITALLGHWIDTAMILAVVVANTVIGYVQEGRAEQALAALRDMLAPQASVWRDGVRVTLPADRLVPGDLVWLEAGERVPADLRLVRVQGLTVDESILTGESVPVTKRPDPVAADAPLGDRLSMAFSGTMVAAGAGAGVVTATGAATEIGRISAMLASVTRLETPLIRQMAQFARVLTGFVLALSAAVLALTVLWRDMPFADSFMIVVGLFVAAIPEGLPAVLTVTLAIGVQIMARRNAVVRHMPAIETLGALSVICTDKTGTLTRNEMTVAEAVTATGAHRVTGTGYAPDGTVERADDPVIRRMAEVARLCNTADLVGEGDDWRVAGDPMEGALLAFAARAGADPDDRPEPATAIPFDARHRFMAVVHSGPAGAVLRLKGAPERVIALCTDAAGPEGPVPLDTAAWADRAEALAARGMRVLALAEAPHPGGDLDPEALSGLTLLGVVGLIDPPRDEARQAVAECQQAGIVVKMITGDHAGTAAAIARQVGLKQTGRVLTGADIDAMDDAALADAVQAVDVFARTSPEHKLRLVTALQAKGAVVAMTGDGVNDAPALKRADAGIAMARRGSAAAREAADLVLTDDNFASIAEAVRQGRTVYQNLTKVIGWTLPTNAGESLVIVAAVLFALTMPITPLQILWVNFVTATTLGVALAFEPPEPQVMQRPPRRRDAPILSRFLLWRVAFVSVLFAAGIFVPFQLAIAAGAPVDRAQTLVVNTLVAMEVFYLFATRFRLGTPLTLRGMMGTPPVLLAVAAVTVLQLAFTYLPAMNALFGTAPLSPGELALCTGIGAALLLVLEVDRRAAALWRRQRAAARS